MRKLFLAMKIKRMIRKGGYDMNNLGKGLLTIFLVMYIVSPLDAMPGPIDDAIVLLIGLAMRKRLSDTEPPRF